MSIPDCGTFEYHVNPRRSKIPLSQDWVGQAISARDASIHPGLAGARPGFRLSGGTIGLRPTEWSLSRWTNKHFREWGRLPSPVSFHAGKALPLALQEGDTVWLTRGGTGDVGISLLREEELVLALGAVVFIPLGRDVQLARDPRVRDFFEYETARAIQLPETTVAWIDSERGDMASWKAMLESIPPKHCLVVAVREKGHGLINEVVMSIRLEGWGTCLYASVDPRHCDEASWRRAMEPLAGGPPKNPYLCVRAEGSEFRVHEGQEEICGPYFVRHERYFQPGTPGSEAILAIARLSTILTEDAVVSSLEPFLEGGRIRIGQV